MDEKIISQTAEALDLRQSDIFSFLVLISSHPSIELKELLRLTGLPDTQFKRLLKSFSFLFESSTNKVVVKTEALDNLVSFLAARHFTTEEEGDIEKILKVLSESQTKRPQAKRQFDQFFATTDTVINRALLLKKQGNLYRRKLLFLGDDDLTSIASALTATECELTVWDIDQDILNTIDEISQKNNLQIKTQLVDLREQIPSTSKNSFDLVFTDPPYTSSGLSLFLNKAITCTKESLTSQVYLCFGASPRARERELVIQKNINERGLLLEEKIPRFNHYNGAESIGSVSSLYILSRTPQTKEVSVTNDRFYTNE